MGIAAITKKYPGSVMVGTAMSDFSRLPTGVFVLDRAIGGGLPLGRVTMVYGVKSAGKTTLSLLACRQAQNLCTNCWTVHCSCKKPSLDGLVIYLDSEGSLDKVWMQKLGLDLDRIHVIRPETAEHAVNQIVAVLDEPKLALVVHDTVAMAPLEDELEKSAGDSVHAKHAKLMTRYCKLLIHELIAERMKNHPITVLLVNQIRASMKTMPGSSPYSVPGGFALEHLPWITLKLWKGPYHYLEGEKKDVERPTALTTIFIVEKNKTACGVMEGEYKLMLRNRPGYPGIGSSLCQQEVLRDGMELGYITKTSKGFSCGGLSYPNQTALKGAWIKGRQLYERDMAAVLDLSMKEREDGSLRQVAAKDEIDE